MQAIIFDSQLGAENFSTDINNQLGYPRRGTLYNGGKHAICLCEGDTVNPECPNVTLSYSSVIKHPTEELWAYEVDNTVLGLGINGFEEVTLTEDWFPIL